MTNNNNEKKVTPRALASRAKNLQLIVVQSLRNFVIFTTHVVIPLTKFYYDGQKL